MVKWLSIILVVFIGFMTILLGLGYLLKENEKHTTALKKALDAERAQLAKKQKTSSSNTYQATTVEFTGRNLDKRSINKKIIKENLTCVSAEQCLLVTVSFADLSCLVAINTIGAAKLSQASPDQTLIGSCQQAAKTAKAACQHNICTLAFE